MRQGVRLDAPQGVAIAPLSGPGARPGRLGGAGGSGGEMLGQRGGQVAGDGGVLALEQAAAEHRCGGLVGFDIGVVLAQPVGANAQLRDVPAVGGEGGEGAVGRGARGGRGGASRQAGSRRCRARVDEDRGARVGVERGGEVQGGRTRGGEVAPDTVAAQRQRAQRRLQRGRGGAGTRALQADLAEVQRIGREVRVRAAQVLASRPGSAVG
jgi:hypothetical protein